MVVEFSRQFLKDLKKHYSKQKASNVIKRLAQTTSSEGDFVALVANIVIREKKEDSFRFYFIVQNNTKHIVTKQELDDMFIKFVALSKKNNQQHVIDTLRKDLKKDGYKFD